MVSDFLYLYGFVPADAAPPSSLAGIGGSAVTVIDIDGVRAAVSRVSADDYDPQRIETRLQDLAWVGQQGVAHESVVAWFVDHAEILPVPLFTMYSSDVALRDAVSEKAAAYQSELQRLRNKREWDVKFSFDEREIEKNAAALSPRIAELEKEMSEAAPGKRYLLQKKKNDLLKTEARASAQKLARAALDDVATQAAEVRALPIPRTADNLPVIVYAALLVERENESELIRALEEKTTELERVGLALNFSGPWAPYRFTENA